MVICYRDACFAHQEHTQQRKLHWSRNFQDIRIFPLLLLSSRKFYEVTMTVMAEAPVANWHLK